MPIITTVPAEQDFSHQWKTSIQRGIKGNEKRSALFTWPRLSLSSKFILPTYAQYSWMKRNLHKDIHNLWEIPIWYDKAILVSQAIAGQTELEVEDLANRHFYDGRDCIIIGDGSYEKGTISSINSDLSITLSGNLAHTWPAGSLVLPLYKFRIQSTQEIKGIQENPVQTIAFDALEEFETARSFSYSLPSSGLETYLAHDLFLTPPKHAITSFCEHPYELLQALGLGYSSTHYDETELGLKLFFTLIGKEAVWNLLEMFDSKRGRFDAFWIPSWNKDIVVTSAIADTDTILTITDLDYDDYYLSNAIVNRHIFIRFSNDSYVCRKIISAPSNTSIEIDSATGIAGLPEMVSFLIFSRFDVDEISFSHKVDDHNSIRADLKTKGLIEEAL